MTTIYSDDGEWMWTGTEWIPAQNQNHSSASNIQVQDSVGWREEHLRLINENKDITLFSVFGFVLRGFKSIMHPSPKLKQGQKTKFQLKAENGKAAPHKDGMVHIIAITDVGFSVIQLGVQRSLKIGGVFSINTSSTNTGILFAVSWKDVLNIYPQKEEGFVIETKSLFCSIRAPNLSSEMVSKFKLKKEIIENYDDNGIPFIKKFGIKRDYTAGFFQKFKEIFDKYKSNGSMSSLGLEIQRSCLTHGIEKLHFRGQFYCKGCDGENFNLIEKDYQSKIQLEEIV